ncbi:hypothetical protein AN958_09887 [Leucoagaricus sp. SymC.cos]|nr:hypothetical protein AN958_09887 [Leucoagaricus sp. SymC.cos]
MAVENVPAEIWGKIFELSCNDNGQTGRSLALVSHYIYAVSKPYQYQSVTLVGQCAIDRFAKLSTNVPECRRVKNLFMSTFKPDPAIVNFIQKEPLHTHSGKTSSPFFQCRTSSSSPPSEEGTIKANHAILSDMHTILNFISPTIQTLHILMDFHREEIFFPYFFPGLQELSIQGPFFDHYDCDDDFCDTLYPRIPSLRRLYLTDVFTCVKDRTYLAIRHYAPFLTHLGIQCADGYIESSRTFLKQLSGEEVEKFKEDEDYPSNVGYFWYGDAWDNEDQGEAKKKLDSQENESQELHFPETLQRIFMQPGPVQPRGRCGTLNIMRCATLRELEKCASEDPRIKLFQESPWVWPYSREYEYLQGEKQWLDSISGGLGFWKEA